MFAFWFVLPTAADSQPDGFRSWSHIARHVRSSSARLERRVQPTCTPPSPWTARRTSADLPAAPFAHREPAIDALCRPGRFFAIFPAAPPLLRKRSGQRRARQAPVTGRCILTPVLLAAARPRCSSKRVSLVHQAQGE